MSEFKEYPTQQEIKAHLYYHPESGVFRWRTPIAIRVKPWDVAGTYRKNGYVLISLGDTKFYAHRLAWIYMTGREPDQYIDHIDGNKHNNSWSNLRPATKKQNGENQKLRRTSVSGFRGVVFNRDCRLPWRAQVRHGGSYIYLGSFATAEEAGAVAMAKRAELYTHYTGREKT